jgi:hypothetical protein
MMGEILLDGVLQYQIHNLRLVVVFSPLFFFLFFCVHRMCVYTFSCVSSYVCSYVCVCWITGASHSTLVSQSATMGAHLPKVSRRQQHHDGLTRTRCHPPLGETISSGQNCVTTSVVCTQKKKSASLLTSSNERPLRSLFLTRAGSVC